MATIISITGNLIDEPELRFTPSGAAVCNFTVAVNERIKDQATNEWKDGDATFYSCAVWRDAAENAAESLEKGMRVFVQGAFKCRPFERKDGSKGISPEINVDEFGPSLRWATAKVTRASKSNNGGNNGGYSQPQGGQQNGYSQPQGGQQGTPGDDPWASPAPAGAAAGGNPWNAQQGSDEPPF